MGFTVACPVKTGSGNDSAIGTGGAALGSTPAGNITGDFVADAGSSRTMLSNGSDLAGVGFDIGSAVGSGADGGAD